MKNEHAVVVSFVTLISGRVLNKDEISELVTLVEQCNVDNKFVDLTLLFKYMSEGKMIEAIREYRRLTDNFLKDAKDAVESVML